MEDYEKRYKEALERATKWYNGNTNEGYRGIFEDIFPELKESEDEKIRKEMLQIAKESEDTFYMVMTPNKRERLIAWLEKQGEKEKFIKKELECIRGYRDEAIRRLNELEKQGEQKQEILTKEKALKNSPFVEQKPADNVEPKFNIGDWISGYYTNYKVLSVNNDGYVVEDVDGNKINILFENEKFHQLWTIKNAKDGDVLSWDDSKCIALFKNIYDKDSFNSHGLVGHCTGTFEPRQSYHDIEGAHPATKEQRDLLFKKMHEAGYEWDADKRKLKKIEQKPVVILKFRIGDTIKNKKTNKIFTISDYSLLYEYYHDINHYHEIKFSEQDDWELVEQNHAWSEEDETALDDALWCCKQAASIAKDENDMGNIWYAENWLKSIKERVQPKQEWSEEIEGAISLLNDMAEEQEKDYCPHNANNLRKAAHYLETCRPQNRWKPSEEQLKSLEQAARYYNCGKIKLVGTHLNEIIEQLKAL